ncbi:RNA-directed DNA polymerase from mobile element jockey [Trichonephila clavipes]|nr:RNA-directed DNA polymerase from mobile element jockey [Trichonephila clavipes]
MNDSESDMDSVSGKTYKSRSIDPSRSSLGMLTEFVQKYPSSKITSKDLTQISLLSKRLFLQPCHSFNIPNYTIYRNDRLTHRGGGTAILIKSSIAHHCIHIHTHTLENTTIVLEGSNKITISCIYRPPNSPHQALIPDLLKILRNRTHCFIVGDYNAKHHSWSPHSNNNPCGSALFKFLKNCGFLLSSSAEPTTIPKRANTKPATIDFGISCGLDDVLVETQVELSSDHNPVQFILPTISDKPHAQNCTTFTNWNLFQDLLTTSIPGNPTVNNSDEIEERISQLTNSIHLAINQSKWDDILDEANFDPPKLHKIIKNQKAQQVTYPPLLGFRGMVYDTLDKANLFADTMEESFQENSEPYNDEFIEKVERKVRRLKEHADNNNIIPSFQHGFRENTATNHQLLRLTNLVVSGFNNHETTVGAFLDVEKAFDRVWHDGLLLKLIELNFPPYIIMIINNFLKNRTFQIKISSTLSRTDYASAGCPQGSLLSPLLYNIFTHDFPTAPTVHICLFADDAAIISQACSPDIPAQVRREERISLSSSAHLRHSAEQLICHFPPASEERGKKKTLSRSRRMLRHDAVYLLFSTPTPTPTLPIVFDDSSFLLLFPPHPTHTEKKHESPCWCSSKEYVPRSD